MASKQMAEDEDGKVMITLKDVYDLLQDVKTTVTGMGDHGDRLADHEKRIRSLERNVWIIVGIGIVAQVVVPLIYAKLFL